MSPTIPGQTPSENHWQISDKIHLVLLWEAMTKGREGTVGVLCWIAREEGSGDSSSTKDKWQEGKQWGFGDWRQGM